MATTEIVKAIEELVEAKVAVILHETGVYEYSRVCGGVSLGSSRMGKFDRLDAAKQNLERVLK